MKKRASQTKLGIQIGGMLLTAFVALAGLFLVESQNHTAVASGGLIEPSVNNGHEIQMTFVTTITVNTTEDLFQEDIDEDREERHTCTFTQGAFYFPANGDSAGQCSLRRAIVEASQRPSGDRPILIEFDISGSDAGADLEEPGTWTIFLDEALPELTTPNPAIDRNGHVTIDGETQPGIRTTGPGIIINAGDTGLQIASTDNIVRNMSWKGVSEIAAKLKADGNTFENLWMGLADDGASLYFRDENNRDRLAIGGLTLASNENKAVNNTISGAFAKAINASGDDNVVTGNQIGTLADGTVPIVSEASKCASSLNFDPANHYGGWGIQVGGSRNDIKFNRIAGLHIIKTPNSTAPPAIEIFGADHDVSENIIGVDSNDEPVGVCGHGIKFSGSGHLIFANAIVSSRVSFEDSDESAILASDTSPTFGQVSVLENIVIDGPGDILTFANGISNDLRFFEPARITNISPAGVLTGKAEEGYPCGSCDIDLYIDNTDEIQEALVHLGTVTADVDGRFTFDMGESLPVGAGIRTMATTNNANVIGNFGAGTTSEASQLYTPITDITFSGPITGFTGVPYQINFQVDPVAVTLPITYSVEITDEALPQVDVYDDRLANIVYIWNTPGTKTIEVTADNGLSTRTESYQIEIEQAVVEGAITDIVFNGPTTGDVNTEYEFFFTMEPEDADTPFDLVLEVTDKTDLSGQLSTRFGKYTTGGWSTPGTKTIKVTATNDVNSLSKSFEIVIAEPPVTPEPTTTPSSTTTPAATSTPVPTGTPSSPSSGDKFIYLPLVVK